MGQGDMMRLNVETEPLGRTEDYAMLEMNPRPVPITIKPVWIEKIPTFRNGRWSGWRLIVSNPEHQDILRKAYPEDK